MGVRPSVAPLRGADGFDPVPVVSADASTTGYYLRALRAAPSLSSPINFRVHCVPFGGLLESQSDAQRRGFVVKSARKHDRSRQARRARETARDANRRMAR